MRTLITKALMLSAFALLITSAGNFISAQNEFCGTHEIMNALLNSRPDVVKAQEELEAFTKEYVRTHNPESSERGGPQYIIPLVFHIIHDRGPENISDAVIQGAVDILNRDYQRLNPDTGASIATQFRGLVGDANIEFRLAQKDPDGNCTNGIDRVYSYRTYQGNDRSKVVIWDRKNYLNIWVVNRIADGGVAAYAYLPAGAAGLGYKVDGVISWYQYVGAGSSGPRTLTHEIGHSFNLSHPWGGGTVATSCGDDGVEDTPVTEGGTACPSNKVDFTCDKDSIKKTWQFNSVTQSSGNIEPGTPIVVPNNNDSSLYLENFRAVGVSANSSVDSAFAFSGWDTGGVDGLNGDTTFYLHTDTINTGKYYEFKVRPAFGQGMTLTRIQFQVKRSLDGPRMFSFRSSESLPAYRGNLNASVIPANANIGVFTDTIGPDVASIFYFKNDVDSLVKQCRISMSTSPFTNTDDTITFRIYAWNAESPTGYLQIDSVAVIGLYGTVENLDNYMDYTYCHHMFTIGQTERMHAALESTIADRRNLWQPANQALTGIDNPQLCPPQADFYVKKSMTCQNTGLVQFFDYSSRGAATSWAWSFPNGSPATSTLQNPNNITFSTLWGQSVTLTATNAAGSSTVTKDNIVWVAPPWADYMGLFYEDFEDASHFNTMWRNDNIYNTTSSWQVVNTGYFPSGTHGLRLNAFSPIILSTNLTPQIVLDWGIGAFDKDDFISPAFDLSHINTGTGKLEFKIAAATRASNVADMTEELKVFYSTNCGNTWAQMASYTGAALNNAGAWQDAFAPSIAGQWVQKTINLTTSMTTTNVRFKFEYTSGDMSNNIYIDDFNISGTVGVEDNNPGWSADLMVFPNPAAGDVSISYRLPVTKDIKLQVCDAIGNLVYELVNQKESAGSYAINFSTSKLSNGIYYVKLTGDNVALRTEKLTIIR